MSTELSQRGGVYHFDRFTLDTVRGALLAAGGTEVALRPKTFSLLVRLVESAGRLVDRDEIMRAVWPDVVVTDDSITKCIGEIRRALGDEDQRLVRTLPRRGFLFAAEVLREDGTATVVVVPEAVTAPASAFVSALPRPASGRPRVTVLPFENIGDDPDQGYFADGLTADLATDLTRFQSLHIVRARRRRAGSGGPDPAGASSLGAPGYVVSGGVRRDSGRVRVTAQLEDAETGVQLWADRFDRPLDDLFAVQEELAGRLAANLMTQVEQEGRRRALHQPPSSLDAYDLCLRGRELHARMTEADTLAARALFEQAIAADPGYAPAQAWMAYTVHRGFYHFWGEPTGIDASRLALTYARRAVALQRESPFCLSRLAFVVLSLRQHDEALELARAAVRLNPSSSEARHVLGDVLIYSGDPEAGVEEARLSLELDPFHPPGQRGHLARALLVAGRHEEAGVEARQVVAQLPTNTHCRHSLAVLAAETGRMEEARLAVHEIWRLNPRWTLRTMEPVWPFRDPAQTERILAAFRAAGLPEG